MYDFLQPVFVLIIIFGSAAFVIKTISDNRLRQRLIDSGNLDEKIKYLYLQSNKNTQGISGSLKWGLVCIGVGLALFIGQLFPYEVNEGMTMGLMFLFGGIGFVIYYMLESKKKDQNAAESE
ncbi:MAG: hypothetical protein E4H13_10575 [Calditrichales bacterium]|nr:MAG: hypothetical protein E4H13_10575 [Calditrichales bacterium]